MTHSILSTVRGHADLTGGALLLLVGALLGMATGLLTPFLGYKPLLIAVGLVGAGIVLWRPYIGFLLVVASLPADVFGVIGSTTSAVMLSVTKILGVLTILAAVVDLLIHQRSLDLRRVWVAESRAAIVFVGAVVLAGFAHSTPDTHIEIIRQVTILIFLLVTIWFIRSHRDLERVVHVLVVVATLVAVQSILQRSSNATNVSDEWVAEAGAVLDVGEASGAVVRTSGTFSHPAWLGLFLSLTVPMTLFIVWTASSRLVAVGGSLSLVIQALGVFSTYSRMAYIGVAIGILLFALRRRLGPGMIVALIVAGFAMFPLLPEAMRLRVYSIVDYHTSNSSLTRIGQQMAGLLMFEHNPLLGVGPGNFEAQVMRYASHIPEIYNVQPIGAHNMYVEIAAETGVVGLAAAVWVLGVSWRDVRRLRKEATARGDRHHAMLFESLGIALIVFIVSAFFVHAQYRKEWWLLIAMIGAGMNTRCVPPQKQEAGP